MSETERKRKPWVTPANIAPHVEEVWAEEFSFALQQDGVSGADIGAALAEVDSHCAESGTSAEESFGEPERYARSLALPSSPEQGTGRLSSAVTPTVLKVLGMLLLIQSAVPLARNEPVPVTVGMLLSFGILAGSILLIITNPITVTRLAAHRRVTLFVAILGMMGAMVASLLLLPQLLANLPAALIAVLGLAVMIASTLWDRHRLIHRENPEADVLTTPLGDPGVVHQQARQYRRAMAAQIYLVPVTGCAFFLTLFLFS